ncbi:S8 family serine peptidase [Candidatus Omnitrophota bacterium]
MRINFRYNVKILIYVIIISFLTSGNANALLDSNSGKKGQPNQASQLQDEQNPQYAPGQVIIKLKEKEDNAELLNQTYSTRRAKHKRIISRLKHKYRLKPEERPVFKRLHKRLKKHNSSQSSLNQSPNNKQKDLLPIYVLETEEDVLDACEKLNRDPEVEYAQPNYLNELHSIPDDPYYSSLSSWGQNYGDLWGLKKIQAEEAWDTFAGRSKKKKKPGFHLAGNGVIVAVLDTGIDYEHQDLADNMWINNGEIPNNAIDDDGNGYIDDIHGWDFSGQVEYVIAPDNDPQDYYGHGSHCAGTIAAVGNNGLGIIGVAPKAELMAVKVFPNAYDEVIVEAIKYAADNGAKVLSNSWGPMFKRPKNPVLEEVIDYAYDEKGCVVVFSAGNSDADTAYYSPANYSKTIAVGASNPLDEKCYFSNYGAKLDVTAPGGGVWHEYAIGGMGVYNILSVLSYDNELIEGNPYDLRVGDNYLRLGGTSMACPHVSGLAALILSAHPNYSNEEVTHTIRATADDIEDEGWDIKSGHGRINAYKAMQLNRIGVTRITEPAYGIFVVLPEDNPILEIKGVAKTNRKKYFDYYELYYAPESDTTNWTLITRENSMVEEAATLGYWDMSSLAMDRYIIKLVMYDRLQNAFSDYSLIDYAGLTHYLEGWPKNVDDFSVEPLFVDLNNDGEKEVVTATPDKVYVWTYDGVLLANWPKELAQYSQAIADVYLAAGNLDDDEELEIVAIGNLESVDQQQNVQIQGIIYVWDIDGTGVSGFPKVYETSKLIPSVIISDINSDGKPEIIYGELVNQNTDLLMHAININQEELTGWPITISGYGTEILDAYFSVGYIDEDIYMDIVVSPYKGETYTTLRGFNYKGEYIRNWPSQFFIGDEFNTDPVVGDVDNDGKMEVGIGCKAGFYLFDDDGELMPNWPQRFYYVYDFCTVCVSTEADISSAALADLNNDGFLEIVFVAYAPTRVYDKVRVFVFDLNGQVMEGWPKHIQDIAQFGHELPSPTIGDIDNDGELDIILGPDTDGFIHAWHKDGTEVQGWPNYIGVSDSGQNSLVDVDNDGDLDIGIGGREIIINEYKETEFNQEGFAWPMIRQNPQRTGMYPMYKDTTPPIPPTIPATPVVTDEGDTTNNFTTLSANWFSDDPETEIAEFQYCITKDLPLAGNTGSQLILMVKPWTSTGTEKSVVAEGLFLSNGGTYYFNVKAKNNEGTWSEIGSSDGITAVFSIPPNPF